MKLLLITNSEWSYAAAMMRYAFDPFLPGDMTWADLFDVKIVAARKPAFFTQRGPAFEVVDLDQGLLRPVVGPLQHGGIYVGGNAAMVEDYIGVDGDQILYVGDHLFSDVHISKALLRWRTALIVRDLEDELTAGEAFTRTGKQLAALMSRKEDLEMELSHLRLRLLRQENGRSTDGPTITQSDITAKRDELVTLDKMIGPLAREAALVGNPRWGTPMRTGNDKSQMARQVERYADIYTSRVSNFLHATPFGYFRSPRGSLPHDF